MDEKKYLKRKEKSRNDGNREQLAVSCNNLGDYYNQEGQFEKAVKEYQEEADLYAKLGKKLEMAKAQRMIGEMFMLLCNFNKALEHIRIYLKVVKSLHNKVEEQRAYATLGRAHLLHGQSSSETSASTTLEQLKLAEKSFLKSLLLIKEITGQITKLEGLDMQARCYLNIGVVKEHMEDFEESIAYIDRAIKICKSHDLFELTHLCYISMSLLYHCKKNDAATALRFCNLALQVAKRLPNKVQKICETLIAKSEILIKAGDFASAKQILTKAYKKNSPNVNDRGTIEKMLRVVVVICQTLDEIVTTSSVDYCKCKKLYERLGDGCCSLNNYVKALEYYQQMLTCAEKDGDAGKALAPIYVSLYQTYKDNHEYDKALLFLWKEYEINKDVPSEAVYTLCGIAEVCELQNQSFWTIQDVYQKAKAHIELVNDTSLCKQLYKIIFMRLKKLQEKHKMRTMIELLEQEAAKNGINLNDCSDDDGGDDESETLDNNTPELGDDVCLDDLTDSDTSDLDETEKHRAHRVTRGTRCLTIKRNNKGETQLHQACIAGNLELVRRLIDQGHAVNVRDHAGWLPLHEACNHGFQDIVKLLLDRGAAVAINDKGGTSCDGITPLYDACVNGFLDVVEILLERGADATVKTDFGETCLNGLDKWRRSAKLTTGEQAHYHQLRTTLLRPLAKVGIVGKAATFNVPLGNTDDEDALKPALLSESDENSCDSAFSRVDRCHQRTYSENERILKDTNNAKKISNASTEYRNVMEKLKHPHRMLEDEPIASSSGSSTSGSKQKRNAFLDCEEIDYDDWLIDDLGPEKKKRRFLTTPTKQELVNCRTSTSTTPTKMNTSHDGLSILKESLHDSNHSNGLYDIGPDWNTDLNDFQTLQESSNVTHGNKYSIFSKSRSLSIGSTSAKTTSNINSGRRSKPKQQGSLLDNGFIRFRSESPNSLGGDSISGFVNVSTGAEPDSTTTMTPAATSIHLVISPAKTSSPIQLHSSQLVPTPISFKIKVEDELLLVPIDRKRLSDVNIRWLAEEASRRYYNSTGLKPLLRLKTADGFAYEDTDPVSIAVEQNMIIASVLEWKIAPLGQRYEEMCLQLKKEINTDVQRSLERAQASNSLELEGFWLNAQDSEPIFRAIFHQSQLRVLDLSNNFLQNEGCRLLAKAVGTLKQLKSLNLSGNFITAAGLEVLLLSNTPNDLHSVQLELEELNVSRNPLGNECLRILDKFCNKEHATLQKLLMAQCGLKNLYDYDLGYFQLTSIDISFNPIQTDSRQRLLGKLNSSRLQCLNISYTNAENDIQSEDASDYIVRFFENGTCEKFKRLELCGCNIGDSQLYRISQCLKKSNALELLDLTGNESLSACSLQYIVHEIPQLRKLIATNCTRFIDRERIQKLTQAKQIPNLLCLTMDECEDTVSETIVAGTYDELNPVSRIYGELCKIWRSFWSDKAQSVRYGSNFVFYTNDKDIN